jgi:cytoskeletal protein CcmA (bactofilin family)
MSFPPGWRKARFFSAEAAGMGIIPPPSPWAAWIHGQIHLNGVKIMAEAGPQDYPTILGADSSFKGELSFEKGVRLHGKLEGKITSTGRLHVAKEARLHADVEAGSITIEGEVHGNLTATDKIELKSSTRFEGDLTASKLVVDEGAAFKGHVTVGPEAVKNRPPGGMPRPMGATPPPIGQPNR